VGLKQREVEGALEQKVRHELPLDRAVPLAVNRGTPVVLADSGCDFTRALRELAHSLVPQEGSKKADKKAVVQQVAAA
jgi:pilus assembly protein CpaE